MEPVDPDAPKEGSPSSALRAAAEVEAQQRARPLAPKDRPKIRPSPNETPTRPRGIEAVKPTHRIGEAPKDRETQPSMQAVKLAEQESRIARARLGAETAPPPAHHSEGATKIVQHVGAISSMPPAEGTADEDDEDPIAKMRALYAQGDAAAALALATELTAGFDPPPLAQLHSTAPPLVLEPGDLVATVPPRSSPSEPAPFSDGVLAAEDDPFGGLIPVEDEEEEQEEVGDLLDEEDPFGGLVAAEPDPMDPISHSGIVAAGRLPIVAVTPRLLVDAREIPSLPIDPRGAFMLTLVDGIQSLEEILDICAMPQDEALELIEKLRLMGVIEI